MLNKIILVVVAALAALLTPSQVIAYGAAHVGYTHVGPNGVYHAGATEASGPRGAYAGGHTSAYGASGGAYHAGYGGAYHAGYGGAAAGGYHYSSSYYGGAAAGSAHYAYIR